jgi:hypothetical protein
VARFLVAQEERLGARVAHRVVVPRREAELVGVLVPGIALPLSDTTLPKAGFASTLHHGAGVVSPGEA